jgi:hypothetical protein
VTRHPAALWAWPLLLGRLSLGIAVPERGLWLPCIATPVMGGAGGATRLWCCRPVPVLPPQGGALDGGCRSGPRNDKRCPRDVRALSVWEQRVSERLPPPQATRHSVTRHPAALWAWPLLLGRLSLGIAVLERGLWLPCIATPVMGGAGGATRLWCCRPVPVLPPQGGALDGGCRVGNL